MRPIVNVPEEDRATATGNMYKKFGKDRAWGSGDILSDRQTDRRETQTQTDALITILHNRSCERNKKSIAQKQIAVRRLRQAGG